MSSFLPSDHQAFFRNSPARYNAIHMQVTVNGQTEELPEGISVLELIARHNLTPDRVAVELNRRLLRTAKYDTPLKANDQVEIVTFVGGG